MGTIRSGNGNVTGGVPFLAHTITADGFDASEDGTGRGIPLVASTVTANYAKNGGAQGGKASVPTNLVPIVYSDQRGRTNGDRWQEDQAFTVHAAKGPSEQQIVAFAFDWQASDGGADDSFRGKSRKFIVRAGGVAGAQGATRQDAVAVAINQRREARLGALHGSVQTEPSASQFNGVLDTMAVRRLTPTEVEALFGLERNYTLVPYRGALSSDGPRYRALGNTIAVPVLRWIGERIDRAVTR